VFTVFSVQFAVSEKRKKKLSRRDSEGERFEKEIRVGSEGGRCERRAGPRLKFKGRKVKSKRVRE
jgi:hypothetical protein